jgi:pimeloyl-ACP methyl ester carboxylesterase
MAAATPNDVPVVFVHGWGGNYRDTWQKPGWTDLMADAGRSVIGVDLLGHGTAPKPHEPEAYSDLTTRVVEAVGTHSAVDAVGFSLGAMTLLELACREPQRFNRLVVMGVGENIFREDDPAMAGVLDAVEGGGDTTNVQAQLFAQYANQPGNDPVALAAVFKRPHRRTVTKARLAAVTCPVLVVIGDNDFAGPGEPLAEALPNAKLVVLKRTDHFATTESFPAIDAVLEFLDALPS